MLYWNVWRMCRRCVWKDHSLKTGFGNVLTTDWKKKKKILLDWTSSVTRSLCKFSFKTFSITETKENKARVSGNCWRLKFQRRRSHSCFFFFFRNVGWHLFWLHLNEHGLHSSQENTGGCSSLYACWRNRETQMGGERGDGGKGSEETELWNKTWLG